ncbi:MAG: ThuA domain-containing protein [Verrucomicrobia bacterium]|nr:ThuA domain-containing protein [Verrucomicrobiota bacterium]MDA1066340.1 ThuA domain-containing protein [Verrucomicrobiota bacterium]
MEDLKIAVITGGHPFDLPVFHGLFREMEGVDAYIQHIDDFGTSPDEIRDAYDAVVFYTMQIEVPMVEDTWFKRDPRPAIERLFERGQGVVALHHSFFAFPEWPFWDGVIGINNRTSNPDEGFSFHFDTEQRVEVRDVSHPILQGVESFQTVDEGYHMPSEEVDGQLLLTVDHPDTMKSTAWTREVGASRIFCFQLGHDAVGWGHPSFRQILRQGISWVVRNDDI